MVYIIIVNRALSSIK